MKYTLIHTARAVREIWKGSGSISLGSILVVTCIIYIALTVITNREFALFLLGIKGREDFPSPELYLAFLENLQTMDIGIITPVVCTLILLIQPANQLKINSIIRLLPISPWTRTASFVLTILIVTAISLLIFNLLEHGTILYVRKVHLSEIRNLQEGFGDLYKNISSDKILASNFLPRNFMIPQALGIITSISLIANLLFLTITLLFKRYSIIKGLLLIAVIIGTSTMLRYKITYSLMPFAQIHVAFASSAPFHYFFIMIVGLTLCVFYLLKEREE